MAKKLLAPQTGLFKRMGRRRRYKRKGKYSMVFKRILGVLVLIAFSVLLGSVIFLRASVKAQPAPSPSPEVSQTPSAAPTPSPTPTPMPTPEPYADKPDIDVSAWEYTLVNRQSLLSETFMPELTSLENGQNFDSRAVDALKAFIAAARAEGLSVYITSSYRSYATQNSLYNNKVSQLISSEGSREAAEIKAKTIVAYPGTSEHQLGLACDIVDKYYEYMNESLADTALLKWMAEHCTEYGFVVRYPQDKTDITGVMYEPWHFRYVGTEAAQYMTKNKLCLEEFLALYRRKR